MTLKLLISLPITRARFRLDAGVTTSHVPCVKTFELPREFYSPKGLGRVPGNLHGSLFASRSGKWLTKNCRKRETVMNIQSKGNLIT